MNTVRLSIISALFLGALALIGTIASQDVPAPHVPPAVQEQARQTLARFAAEDALKAQEVTRQAEKDSRASEACMTYTRQAVRHPSTVVFNHWRTVVAKEKAHRLGVRLLFTATNSFGLALQHESFCLIDNDRVIRAMINETL